MAYAAPYVDASGLHIPSYDDIRDQLLGAMRAIYGQDVYLENDSADYEMLSAFALKAYDTQQSALLAYLGASPRTALGTGLDSVVALCGIKRSEATRSVCMVTLGGTPGTATTISGGAVSDRQGNIWALPAEVTIPASGSTEVEATAVTAGYLVALPGDIDTIVTPTRGWLSVTNAAAATPGRNQETDTELRARQALSVAGPSRSPFEGTLAAVAAVTGLTRLRGYENDTSEIKDGLPAHSITIVAEGGEDGEVAQAIYRHKTPGCYTNGDVAVDIEGAYGIDTTIRFFRPAYVPVLVAVTLKKLAGYTDDMAGRVKENIVAFLNGLRIGENVYAANINVPILQALPTGVPAPFYVQSLTARRESGSVEDVLVMGLTEAAQAGGDSVTVAVV
jgi:uncharacterized phage protein gp47/JayE